VSEHADTVKVEWDEDGLHLHVETDGSDPRVKVWYCDECGYWRKEQATGRHQTTNPYDPNGHMVSHQLREVEFVLGDHDFRVADPEALLTAVWDAVAPWLAERDAARVSMPARDDGDGYALDDPKHPTYHERMSGLWDNRDRG